MAALSPAPAQEASEAEPVRLANGVAVEGTVKKSAPEGLTIETPKGVKTLPWKYLSAGTRYRHERPMLAELEAKRIKAEKEALAKAEAAAKAAAAEAAKKAAGANAAPAAATPASKATTPAVTAPTVTVPTVPSAIKPSAPAAK